jgi:hypothetical protein
MGKPGEGHCKVGGKVMQCTLDYPGVDYSVCRLHRSSSHLPYT